MIQSGDETPFEKVARESLSAVVTFKQRHAGWERISTVLQAERKTNTKAFRQTQAWHIMGRARSAWLELMNEGEAEDGRCQTVQA